MDRRIDEIMEDAVWDNEYFVELKPGWRLDPPNRPGEQGQHCFGATGMDGVNEEMKRVVPCDCPACKEDKEG